jgi:exonuclease III
MVNQSNVFKTKSSKNNVLKIFHQNIRGLRNKCNEILCNLKEQTPHVLCLTEHHLEGNEIVHLNLDNYNLGAYYSRKHFKKGGTCIYICT